MKNLAWTMTVDTAMEFFKRCIDRKAETEQERVEILLELAAENKISNIVGTNKTKEEFIKDKAKHFRVFRIENDPL